jgi:transposase
VQAGQQRPSYEELADLVLVQARVIKRLRVEVAELRADNERLRAENAELKRRLGMNSTNSSQPPSSDGLAKLARKSLRGNTGRKPGGQVGHPGATLTPVAVPDEVIRHEPTSCRGCGGGLADAVEVGVTRRQVFDLPEIAVRVTEHQVVARRCDCGKVTGGVAPAGVYAPVSYGPRIRRDHRLPVPGTVLVEEKDCAGVGRVVRHARLYRHGRLDHPARRGRPERVP